jgi:3-oxoacyl-[acyl-carrier-protein] synthase-1
MKRVVVTGLGIVSSIGNNKIEVVDSLKQGRSGIVASEVYKEMGFRSQVHGPIKINLDDFIDRKIKRFMGDGAALIILPCSRPLLIPVLKSMRSLILEPVW